MENNFYCQKVCGDTEFSIDEWNKAFGMCVNMGLSEYEMSKIMEGEPCKSQCVDCACIVGRRRIKTQKLILLKTQSHENRIRKEV